MDYTSSPNYVTHYGTGQRMHEANQALPTVVSDQDMNMVLWSLMEVVKESGLPGIPFSKDSPTSYQRLRDALRALYMPKIEYSSVPTSNNGLMIVVTQPHLRVMVWSGSQYVRAPWHQPCELFFSYDNPAMIPGALPVRADVSYQQSNYPDVVARLGLSGSGTFSLVEARGEFLRVLDNGRDVDPWRQVGSAQAQQIQAHKHISALGESYADALFGSSTTKNHRGMNGGIGFDNFLEFTNDGTTYNGTSPNSNGVIGAETRPRNVAFPLWMTI